MSMADIMEDNSLSEEKISDIVSGMYELLKEALRLPLSSMKQEVRLIKKNVMEGILGDKIQFLVNPPNPFELFLFVLSNCALLHLVYSFRYIEH